MGYIAHHAVVVTCFDYPEGGHPAPDVDAFRSTLPPEFTRLVIGPILMAANGSSAYCFLPDGSKEGWDTSNDGDEYRQQFIELFRGSYCDVAYIRFGGDEPDIQAIADPLRGLSTGLVERWLP